jgi:hypothetical protein
MKNVVVWDVTSCGFCNNHRFGGTDRVHLHGQNNQRARNNLIITGNVPSSLILITLMMEAIRSSDTSVLTRTLRRPITEDDILHRITRVLEVIFLYTCLLTIIPQQRLYIQTSVRKRSLQISIKTLIRSSKVFQNSVRKTNHSRSIAFCSRNILHPGSIFHSIVK